MVRYATAYIQEKNTVNRQCTVSRFVVVSVVPCVPGFSIQFLPLSLALIYVHQINFVPRVFPFHHTQREKLWERGCLHSGAMKYLGLPGPAGVHTHIFLSLARLFRCSCYVHTWDFKVKMQKNVVQGFEKLEKVSSKIVNFSCCNS